MSGKGESGAISYFDEIQDFLEEGYKRAEQSRLLFWERLSHAQDKMQAFGVIEKKDRITLGKAEYKDDVLKIVIDDYLPRRVNVVRNALLSMNWTIPIIEAMEILEETEGVKPQFKNALCVVIAYIPCNAEWDIDNRAIKLIIDGLRYTKVTQGDAWDKVAYMAIGRVDSENPRTEVYVIEWARFAKHAAWFLPDNL